MNKFIYLTFFLLIATCSVSGQNTNYVKRPSLAIHFLFNDFESAKNIKATSLKQAFKDHKFGHSKYMKPGFAVSYMQGLNSRFDLSTGLSGSFLDYPFSHSVPSGSNKLLLEWDAMVFAKMLSDKHLVSPYVSAGIGALMYNNYYGAFIPLGVGMQVNIVDEAFVLVNAQYRMRVSERVNYHFYYSIGIAANILKKQDATVITPPHIPFVSTALDRDNDGVVDSLDACPDKPGLKSLQGCPDADNDGIADKDDKCPTVPGVARYYGCPIPDTDGDGINDEEDRCVTVAGVARYQGCPIPDTDGDGVNDEDDKCPTIIGTQSNYGCPVVSAIAKNKVKLAAKNIFFATGRSELLSKSYASLNDVFKMLKDSSNFKLSVIGHTDNTGSLDINIALSQKRAEAVKEYLVSKGILESRIESEGFGPDQPIADNNTEAGRTRNRRVEMKLKY